MQLSTEGSTQTIQMRLRASSFRIPAHASLESIPNHMARRRHVTCAANDAIRYIDCNRTKKESKCSADLYDDAS